LNLYAAGKGWFLCLVIAKLAIAQIGEIVQRYARDAVVPATIAVQHYPVTVAMEGEQFPSDWHALSATRERFCLTSG